MADDLESLKGILLGLGLKELPKLMASFHKVRKQGHNVSEGRAPDDHGTPPAGEGPGPGPAGDAYDPQSQLLPLIQQLGLSGIPMNSPGMRPGNPQPMPAMPGLPRTLQASAGRGGL